MCTSTLPVVHARTKISFSRWSHQVEQLLCRCIPHQRGGSCCTGRFPESGKPQGSAWTYQDPTSLTEGLIGCRWGQKQGWPCPPPTRGFPGECCKQDVQTVWCISQGVAQQFSSPFVQEDVKARHLFKGGTFHRPSTRNPGAGHCSVGSCTGQGNSTYLTIK